MARSKKVNIENKAAPKSQEELFQESLAKIGLPRMSGMTQESRASRGISGGYGLSDSISGGLNGELLNIAKGVCPHNIDGSGNVSVRDTIELCQKAYWNVPIFRSTIDIQTEFSNSRVHFKAKNKNVVKFFEKWYTKINGFSFGQEFFREWFRSGNVFVYKMEGALEMSDIRKMSRTDTKAAALNTKKIPLKYTILNPADMRCRGAASFVNAKYAKVLNKYEIERLKNPLTDEDKELFNMLDPEAKKAVKNGSDPILEISSDKLVSVFCGKQSYEGLAVPMYYPVLYDINLKLEFKKVDMVLARAVDYCILLVTAGEKDRDSGVNNMVLGMLKDMFESESVGRVLVSDYTTEAQYVVPDLNKILGPQKYEVVNQDITNGLMNIFWGEEKFANSMVKIKVFLERLKSAREAYLNNFLKPEMEKIAKILGFTEVPEVSFDEVDLRDEVEYMKIYTRLAELGVLAPNELFEALETHNLPLYEVSLDNQEEYKKLRDKGLYKPLLGGSSKDDAANGRPSGTKAPQKTKKVAPMGASREFSVSKLKESVSEITSLASKVEEHYKKFNGIQRVSKTHRQAIESIVEDIMISSASKDVWEANIPEYVENQTFRDVDPEILEIAAEHEVAFPVAALLKNSVKN